MTPIGQKYETIVILLNARLQHWVAEYQDEFTVINLRPVDTDTDMHWQVWDQADSIAGPVGTGWIAVEMVDGSPGTEHIATTLDEVLMAAGIH